MTNTNTNTRVLEGEVDLRTQIEEDRKRKTAVHNAKVVERRDRLLAVRAMPNDSNLADVVDAALKVLRSLRLVKWEDRNLLKYYSLSGKSDPGFGTKYADLLGIAQCRMKWALDADGRLVEDKGREGVDKWIDRVLDVLPRK